MYGVEASLNYLEGEKEAAHSEGSVIKSLSTPSILMSLMFGILVLLLKGVIDLHRSVVCPSGGSEIQVTASGVSIKCEGRDVCVLTFSGVPGAGGVVGGFGGVGGTDSSAIVTTF